MTTEESKDSEEKDRVKEEIKKTFPTLQTLVHNAPNCYFWCGSTTLGDVVVFESSAGSKKSSEDNKSKLDPVWQKYVEMFVDILTTIFEKTYLL